MGYSRFQMTEMIEGFFLGLKFSILGFLWVEKFDKYFFVWLDLSGDLSRDFFGYLKQFEDLWWCPHIPVTWFCTTKICFVVRALCTLHLFHKTSYLILYGNFLRLRNSAWDFLWVNFSSMDFFGFCWKP